MRRVLVTFAIISSALVLEAETEVKTFTLATGEVLVFTFRDGIPEPSESKWAILRGAGPAIAPDDAGYRLNWIVDLKSKGEGALAGVTSVSVQEISGKSAQKLFSGTPKATNDGLLIVAPAELVSRLSYPWLYTSDRTVLVFRVELMRPGMKSDVLLQPVLIGPEVKKQLKDAGYLP